LSDYNIRATALRSAACLLIASVTANCFADSELEEVLVTARSIEDTLPLELAHYGHDVEDVTAARIKAASYVDVSSALQSDGVRISNRIFNDTSPDTLPANMVERVEVLKGGESLFYGTQAVAGAINIVTRAFSPTLGGEVSPRLRFQRRLPCRRFRARRARRSRVRRVWLKRRRRRLRSVRSLRAERDRSPARL
jgi:TonB-dependent Receptor Plug Domain